MVPRHRPLTRKLVEGNFRVVSRSEGVVITVKVLASQKTTQFVKSLNGVGVERTPIHTHVDKTGSTVARCAKLHYLRACSVKRLVLKNPSLILESSSHGRKLFQVPLSSVDITTSYEAVARFPAGGQLKKVTSFNVVFFSFLNESAL